MSDDLIFGVKLNGDGTLAGEAKAARDEILDLKKATDDLAASSSRSARGQGEDWAKLQQRLNEAARSHDNARDKAWALASGYQQVGGEMVKTGGKAVESLEQTAWATQRAQQEMVVLGREVASGNFSRMPGTLSIIAQGLSPVALGIGAVTAALAAGVWAWREWQDIGSRVSRELKGEFEEAVAAAEESKRLNAAERLAAAHEDVYRQEAVFNEKLAELNAARLVQNMGSHNKELAERIMVLAQQTRIEKDHLDNLRQIAQEDQEQARGKLSAEDEKKLQAKLKAEFGKINAGGIGPETAGSLGGQLETEFRAGQDQLFKEGAGMDLVAREQEVYERKLQASGLYHQKLNTSETAYARIRERIEEDHQNKLVEIEKLGISAKVQMGKAAFVQDLATIGKESAAFMALYKLAAVSEIMAAGGVRAEKSAAWAATWGGPPAASAAWLVSWGATLMNVALVSGLAGGGGSGGAGSGVPAGPSAGGGTSTYPYAPEPVPVSSAPALAPQQLYMTVIGAKENPDKPLFSYNWFVDEFLPLSEAAARNGIAMKINVEAA